MALTYYEYISDSKVDMLLPQIPLAIKQKVSAEIGIDIKVFSAKVKTEHDTLEERVTRLKAVTAYIMDTENVGSVTSPQRWIYSQCIAKFGYLDDDAKMIGYTGNIGEYYYVLFGSSGNVIGMKPDDADAGYGYSFMPRLMEVLDDTDRELEKNLHRLNETVEGIMATPVTTEGLIEKGITLTVADSNVAMFIGSPWKNYKGPEFEIEFLAKRLFERKVGVGGRLLATPLYVARVD